MAKIGKPRGLIDYITLNDEPLERAGNPPRSMLKHAVRPRTLLYTGLWAGIGVAMTVALFIRPDIDVNVSPIRSPVFITMADGSIRNAYEIRLRNKHGEPRFFHVSVTSDEALFFVEIQGEEFTIVEVPSDATRTIRVYLSAAQNSKPATQSRTEIRFWVEDIISAERAYANTIFNGNPR